MPAQGETNNRIGRWTGTHTAPMPVRTRATCEEATDEPDPTARDRSRTRRRPLTIDMIRRLVAGLGLSERCLLQDYALVRPRQYA